MSESHAAREEQAKIIALLRSTSILSGLPEEGYERLAAIGRVLRYSRDKMIFQEGDPGEEMYLVMKGSVDIVREAEDGARVRFVSLDVGSVFGEMALFDEVTRSASAVASARKVRLFGLQREAFLELLGSHPEIGIQLIAWQSQRLRQLSERMVETDFVARKHQPTLEEQIVEGYPYPIAQVFHDLQIQDTPAARLSRLCDLIEVVWWVVDAWLKGLYFQHSPPTPARDLEVLEAPRFSYEGLKLQADALLQTQTELPPLALALVAWLNPSEAIRRWHKLLDLRKIQREDPEDASSHVDPAALFEEHYPVMLELLETAALFRDACLVQLTYMTYRDGVFQFNYLKCMGAYDSFVTEQICSPTPYESDRLHLLDAATGALTPLHPWLGLWDCELCGELELFFATVDSASQLSLAEYRLGHQYPVDARNPELFPLPRSLSSRLPHPD